MIYPGLRDFIWLAAVVFASIANLHSASRPNVLFISIDDLRTDLGCYGHPEILSPNIDGLALEGVRFKHAYCQQSVCNPSRASVLTGLRPDATQVHGNHSHYREAHPQIATLPQHFKRHGYFAQAFGKIYHGVFPEGSSKTVADTFGDPQSWSAPAYRPGPRYYYTEEGIEQAKLAFEKMYGPEAGVPEAWTKKLVFGPMTEAPDVTDETLYDGMVARRAISALQSLAQDRDRPFFLAVGFIKPHSPFVAPKKYWDLYDPAKLELAPDQSPPAGAPRLALHRSGEIRRYTDQPGRGKIPEENQRRMKHGYAACISYVDAQVGNVLAALDELGLRDNTIVVLWSDHGYHLGEKALWGKTTNFELDTRVPIIVSAPGKAGNGQATGALVELVDLYPTLIELAGLPAPDHSLQGLSFVPVLEAPDRAWKRAAFSQFTRGERRGYSLTDGRFRYTEWIDLESGDLAARELYDHNSDPGERQNLASDPGWHGDAMRMATLLQRGEGWRFSKPIQFRLGLPFGDHMVLQRGKPVPVWGTAGPGVEISVAFSGQEKSTVVAADGNWSVSLDPMAASAAGEDLVVTGGDEALTIVDVLVGEVWLCSGQSNMRWMYQQSLDAKGGRAAADNPEVRLLDFTGKLYPSGQRYPLELLRDVGADDYYSTEGWELCSPESASTFSAVAYYFGLLLQEQLGVPVGLVHNAIGGIPMGAFIPTASSSAWLADADVPAWCRSRAGENMAAWLERPVAPTP
ncbi:MAG: sulfatase-like hydrolase/transferase, partial [Verrucomicrobiales bacterium]